MSECTAALLTLLLVHSANAAFEDDCLALNADSVKSVYVFGSCFVIDTLKSLTFDLATGQCVHMSYPVGRLAVAHVKTLTQILASFLTSIGVTECWTGLRQYDKAKEPDGSWEWVLDSGSARSDLINWNGGDPNNYANLEDCAVFVVSVGGYWDMNCINSYRFMCQYVNPIRERCYSQHLNHRFSNSTEVSDEGLVGAGTAARHKCAKKCGRHPLCFGYEIKRSDGHCLLHQDDGQWVGMEPFEDDDYDLYVMK